MKKWCNPYGKDFALLVLRIGLGVIFMWHGIDKLQHMPGVIGFFGQLGFSPFMAWLVAWIETIGGAFILLGLFVPLASLSLAIIMVTAIFAAKFKMIPEKGFTLVEIDIALLCMSVALLMSGAGRFSLGRACFCCRKGKCKADGTCPCHALCGNACKSNNSCNTCGTDIKKEN